MTAPISVDEYLGKASPTPSDNAVKAMVVMADDQPENASNIMAQEAISLLESAGCEVAQYKLPKMRIHPCVNCYGGGGRVCVHPCDRNDVESDIYRPDDAMVELSEQLIACDLLVLATDVRWGAANHYAQRFIERLNPFVNQAAMKKPVLKDKVASLLVAGDGGLAVTGQLMMALSAVGFIFPRYAFTAFHVPRGASADSTRAALEKSTSVHTNIQLMVDDCVSAIKGMRGE